MPDTRRGSDSPSVNRTRRARGNNRRVLSQNFLREPSGVAQYMSMADFDPDDLVVEVGAGDGALTTVIAGQARQLIAYEIDPYHAHRLSRRVQQFRNVRVMPRDFLSSKPPREPFVVAGNVPFSITSEVVNWCLQAGMMKSAILITQLEYAKKRTGAYHRWSLVTIRTWPWISWQLRGRITRDQFRPVPKVDAGVLRLTRRDKPLLPESDSYAYHRMVEIGFGGVGGTLYKSLVQHYPRASVAAAFDAAGIDRGRVVAFVTPEEWLRLFRALRGTSR